MRVTPHQKRSAAAKGGSLSHLRLLRRVDLIVFDNDAIG